MPRNLNISENIVLTDFIEKCLMFGKIGNATKKLQDQIQNNLNINSPSAARLNLVEQSELLEEIQRLDQATFAELKSLGDYLEGVSREHALKFEREFPDLAISEGIMFCEGTLHPNYFIDRSYLEVRVNVRNMNCIIRTRGGKEHQIGIEPHTVVAAIKFHLNRIHNREISDLELLNRIEKIYSEMTASGTRSGEGVSIREFVKSYQKIHKCALDETIFDISRAHKRFQQLKLDYVRDHEQGYQLYGFEENGYFGFIRLEGN